MNAMALTFDTDVRVRVDGMARRLDHQIPVFLVRLKVGITNVHLLAPENIFRSMPARFTRQMAVPMSNYANQETAYQHSRHMLSTVSLIPPQVVLQTAPEIASQLRHLSQHIAIQEDLMINSVGVDIHMDIESCYWYPAALDWPTAIWGSESMQSQQPIVPGVPSSYDPVEELLQSSRAEAWDSKTQCAICLQCLGGDEEEESGTAEEEDEVVISLPTCSHLFHRACIGKWFEVSDTCPLCRRRVNVVEVHSTENP